MKTITIQDNDTALIFSGDDIKMVLPDCLEDPEPNSSSMDALFLSAIVKRLGIDDKFYYEQIMWSLALSHDETSEQSEEKHDNPAS